MRAFRAVFGGLVAGSLTVGAATAGEGPQLRCENVKDMLRLRAIPDKAMIMVSGYHRPGDDGGGTFRYSDSAKGKPDGGTVLDPAHLPGRLIREVDPRGEVHAEWFGAWGDGKTDAPHDDHAAINACLERFGKVNLLARTYGVRGKPEHYDPDITYHAIDLGPNYRIKGSGRAATVIRLLEGSNPKGSAPGNNYFNLLANRRFHESAENVVVQDLTIDCNFDGQNKHTTINAIGLRGGGALVERVNFRGYGTGRHPETGSSRECFALHQGLVFKDRTSSRKAATYRDLDFTAPGHNGDVGGHVGEITHITLGGAHNFGNYSWIIPAGYDPEHDPSNEGENENNWWPSSGGLVENCVVHDEAYTPATQQSPLHAITYGDCVGLVIRNNRVENFEGAGVFVMSWWNRDTIIVDNKFINVHSGLAIHIKGKKGIPVQCPRHEDLLVERNRIVLGAAKHHRWGPIGVQLYGQDLSGIRFTNITVRNNQISGRSYPDAKGKTRYPLGISLQILRANCKNLLFENNLIDVPDYGTGVTTPQEPHSLAIRYFPLARWNDDAEKNNVVFRENRSPEGNVLNPSLADWYFKNKPTWGLPTGTTPAIAP